MSADNPLLPKVGNPRCPYCNVEFKALAEALLRDATIHGNPVICISCGKPGLMILTIEKFEPHPTVMAAMQSALIAWRSAQAEAQKIIDKHKKANGAKYN